MDNSARNLVLVDHFKSCLKGRTCNSMGGMSADQYFGGCVFVDSISSLVHVEHRLGFSGSETIQAKQSYENMALDHGILINSYKPDNGFFKANECVSHIREPNQKLSYCGVNVHQKNGVAEGEIHTMSEYACSFMLYMLVHWEQTATSDIWSMVVYYAVYPYSHLPNEKGIAPADLFTGVTVLMHKLRDCHMWGASVCN